MFRKLKAWFRGPRKVEIIRRDPLRLTVEEFRADRAMTNSAIRILSDPIVRQMLDVLQFSHLGRYTASGNMEEKAAHLCRCEGYLAAINDFYSLARYQEPKQDLVPTFDDSPIEKA